MGRQLLTYCPAFREVIESCGREFSRYGDWSLLEELSRGEETSRMQQTHIAQPSLFAIQVGLAAVWKSWGIEPAVIVGHSVGEIAAAYISGALTFGDACAVGFHRGRTMDLASSRGAMLAVGLSLEEIQPYLARLERSTANTKGLENDVAIAAVNGPASLTLSGPQAAINSVFDQLNAAGVFCRKLKVEYAFHSSQMDPVRDELLRSLSGIKPKANHTELISTVTGKAIDGRELTGEYWWRNVRCSVLFADAMTELAVQDCSVALELGPHPVLAYSITECFQHAGKAVRTVTSLHREQDDLRRMAESLAELYTLGADVRWSGYYTPPTRKLNIPNYPFQRIRCWSESRESRLGRLGNAVHPLLGESQHRSQNSWQARIDLRLQSYLADHRVRGACVYPAAALIESALAAALQITASETIQLDRLRLLNPCVLADGRAQWIETTYRADRRWLEMQSRLTEDDQWSPLFTTEISSLTTGNRSAPEAVATEYEEAFDGAALYAYCKRLGLDYGPAFRGMRRGTREDGAATAEVELDLPLASESQYNIHPALLDACFHGMIAADADFDHTLGGLYLPAEIRRVRFWGRVGRKVRVHVRLVSKTSRRMIADIDIFDRNGARLLSLEGFESLRVQGGGKPAESVQDLVYKYKWVPQTLNGSASAVDPKSNRWLVFQDQGPVGERLCGVLRQLGFEVIQARAAAHFDAKSDTQFAINPERIEDFRSLIARANSGSKAVANIVYLWGLDAGSTTTANDSAQLSTDDLQRSSVLTTLAPMHLIQAWESSSSGAQANLAIVTQVAQSLGSRQEPLAIAQTPLVGFGRVIISEYGALRSKLIDLPAADASEQLLAELLAMHSLSDGDEDEVAWRDGERLVHRFVPADGLPLPVDAAEKLPCKLQMGRAAGVEDLQYRAAPEAALPVTAIEIEVLATGLNFSDVMKALELYPGLPEGPVALGAECCGRVRRVGAAVTEWQIGEEVIAIAPGSFATHVVVDAQLVARKPRNLSHSQAAAIPIAFLTAEYALNQCARIRVGETVLIHAASGGVGLAAMQLAEQAGATVFATAGNEEKRAYVKQQGAKLVMDSRSLNFVDAVLEATQHQDVPGVDVILNSLPGEAISKGVSILRTGGRFLEIGKRDIYNDASLGLFAFRNNLAFFAIDLDQLFKQQPARMGDMLRSLVTRFDAGELHPVLTKDFVADDTRAAFRFMQQGKHIGKVSVSYSPKPSEVYPGEYVPISLDRDATYWIAGGLGGFGLQVAKWLASRGAGSLVLSSRREVTEDEAKRIALEFAGTKTQISILPTDITSADNVSATLSKIEASLPRLAGVFHTAMVLEDRMLVDLDRATLERVLWPKVLGGWNLHQQTLGHDLDHFVLFSSLSSVFGHAGQANYSAANALLDGLAHYRRSRGLPGLAMNWGHLGEVGYLAERQQLGQRLERQGVLSFTVKQALACLEYAMQLHESQLSVLRMDWSLWRGLGITSRVSPRFAHLLRSRAGDETASVQQLANAEQLRAAEGTDRAQMVERLLRFKAGSLLGIASEHIQRERALLEMGLDSLMAVEMRNWIESQMEISVPIAALMRSASLGELVVKVLRAR